MREVSQKVFEAKCRNGEWEAMHDPFESGLVEVRVCKSGKRMWVQIR